MLIKARAHFVTFAAVVVCSSSALSAAEVKAGGPWTVGNLVIEAAWARTLTGENETAVVYLTIKNKSGVSDLLFAAKSPTAKVSVIQEFKVANKAARDMPMGIHIAALDELVMRPGESQILVKGLLKDQSLKTSLPMKLIFHEAGSIEIEVPIIPRSQSEPKQLHRGHFIN